ncbi:hypothetical protein WH52_05390 [Tenacibaculum holothuriorum]|uniref:Secretion system C-terminal sorting domain-containing protein n=1 Tax=Tenacibaculum holothuriorum TaxID=1635173 RepID=A0A1Y2PEY2_9FLAO|nr:T9SS type A sorting domain-containing protein [Tenacibaculum holothuriorum]OSY88218.1 hypothetical protein WH52_05390 [Tenacibaculum holothuriorum]
MKKSYFLILFLLTAFYGFAQNVNISDTNFKSALLSHTPTIDTNSDGEIQVSEAAAFSGTLNLISKNITDLTGIETFINITQLSCRTNNISSIDISKNVKLTFFDCSENKLQSIDFSKNTELTRVSCLNNNLTTLDLSNNLKITDISCSNNQLTSIITPNSDTLNSIVCNYNKLNSLDITKNIKIKELHCFNNNLTSLDISQNTDLNYLACSNNKLQSLDVSKNLKLKQIYCGGNQLPSIDFTKNTVLTQISIKENNIESIDLSNNLDLFELVLEKNKLTSLDLSKHSKLELLNCRENNLNSLNVANGTNVSLSLIVATYSNPNLTCITVDDVSYSTSNWTSIDSHSSFSKDCSKMYTLTKSATNGEITVKSNPENTRNNNYENGTEITLTAVADTGYQFVRWEGDITNNNNPHTFTIDSNKSVTAIFEPSIHKVTTNSPNGTITISPNSSDNTYTYGTALTLKAVPNNGYKFKNWSGDISGTNTTAYTSVTKDMNITANFIENKHFLTINSSNGMATVSPTPDSDGKYKDGTEVTITVNSNSGYIVDNINVGNTTYFGSPITLKMDGDKTVNINYTEAYELILKHDNGNINVSSSGKHEGNKYKANSTIELTAIPETGYEFENWSDGASGITNPLTITMNANKNITAIFKQSTTTTITTYASGFSSLEGVAVNSNNEVYISEHDSGKIFKLDNSGNATLIATSGFRANGLAFDNANNLYIAAPFSGKILIADTSNNLTEYVSATGDSPYGIVFKNNEMFYVSETNSKVVKVKTNKSKENFITGFYTPEDIAFDSNGNTYVTDRNDRKLFKIAPNGTKTIVASGYAAIRGVAIARNMVYFTTYTSSTNKIVKYNPSTNEISDYVTTNLNDPRDIAIDKLGNMYVTNSGNGTVVKIYDENLKPDTTASNNDYTFSNAINIFPNPANDYIEINATSHIIKKIILVDLVGKEIINTTKKRINISNLPTGVYVLKITNDNNKIATKKFIKQ